MRTKSSVPAATFKALFQELITCSFIYALLRRCGVRRRCPPVITAVELIQGLVLLFGLIFILINIGVDLTVATLNPRLRHA